MAKKQKSLSVLVEELRTLVFDYVRQETVDPAKFLLKSFGFSVGGGLMLGFGFALSLVGVLRLFQWLFGQPAGDTWASLYPYLATMGVAIIILVVIGVALSRLRGPRS